MFADDALGKRRVFFAEHSLVDDARVRVHDLYHHLAARNLAIVQGGLTTVMELIADRRLFIYSPLKHHFEQNLHVPP